MGVIVSYPAPRAWIEEDCHVCEGWSAERGWNTTNGGRPLSRVENLLLMLDWVVAGSLIPLDSRGFAVLESFSKRAFGSILG